MGTNYMSKELKESKKNKAAPKAIMGAGDSVPFAWTHPLVDMGGECKMSKVLKNIKKGEQERECLLPTHTEG